MISTKEKIHEAYKITKKVHLNQITVSEGAKNLVDVGMKKTSGLDFIYAYSKLIQGKLYTRTINAYATDYYLKQIHLENGDSGLKNALLSLYQHIEYYEDTSGSSVKKGREIYEKYYNLIRNDFGETIFPDEVENGNNNWEIELSQGKNKSTLRRITAECYKGKTKTEAEKLAKRILQNYVTGKRK